MACRHCSCSECEDHRKDPRNWRNWRDAASLEKTERDQIHAAMDGVFSKYSNCRINVPCMINLIMQTIKVQLQDYHRLNLQTERYLHKLCERGGSFKGYTYSLTEGADGGLFRELGAVWLRSSPLQKATAVPIPQPSIDYTCKGCNVVLKALSQEEKSCYRCGEPIAR